MDFKYVDIVLFLKGDVAYTEMKCIILLYIHILNALFIYEIIPIKILWVNEYRQ